MMSTIMDCIIDRPFPSLLKLGLKSVLERGDFYDLRNGPRTWFKENNKLTLRDPYII